MTKTVKLWPFLFLGITTLATILLAAGLSGSTLHETSQPFPVWLFKDLLAGETPIEQAEAQEITPAPDIGRLGFYLVVSLLILWLVTFIFNPEMRKRMLGRLLLYTAILLTIYVLYGHFQKLELDNQANGDDVEIGLGGSFLQEQPPLPPLVANPPPWLVNVITLAIIALALAAGWWVWQRYLRRQHQPDLAILLAQKARHAVKNLEAGSDLKDTVLRCYRDMSQVLYEQRGIQRQQGMTPREFEAHLAEIGLRDHHIQRLTRLFESVRYGDNTASEREKREARDCLNAIVRVYGRLA